MKTTIPKEPIKDFEEWRKYIADQGMNPEAKCEADFMRIWARFKQDVIEARTKKK